MGAQDLYPARARNPDTYIVAGRFLCNGTFSAATDIPAANYISGRGYRVRFVAAGRYRIFPTGRAAGAGDDGKVLSLVGSLAVAIGTAASLRNTPAQAIIPNQTGQDLQIVDGSDAALDLTTASAIEFIMVVQRTRGTPEK